MGSGYEIAYNGGLGDDLAGKLIVYLDSEPNPMTDEAWATYEPPEGYSLNTPRSTCFDVLELLGSPDVPTGEYTSLTTSDNYTWISVAALARSIYPYVPITVDGVTLTPQQIAYSLTTPPEGVVIVDSNDKNHANIHWGLNGPNAAHAHLQYFVMDAWDNKYILKSVNSEYNTPEKFAEAFEKAVLPNGWTKLTPAYFDEDVTYTPIYSGTNDSLAHANEFRDSADSAWTQIEWGSAGITLNAMTAGGLPIWGSPRGGRLLGNTEDNLIYGGQGNDTIFSLAGNDTVYGGRGSDSLLGGSGDDFFDGNEGLDSIILDGDLVDFAIIQTVDGTIRVTGSEDEYTLLNVERLEFANGVLGYDIDGNAGQAYRLYQAALGRAPDTEGLGYWIDDLDQSVGEIVWLAANFLYSDEFTQRFGDASLKNDLELLYSFYDIAFDRAPDEAGLNYWLDQLSEGMSREKVLASFSESTENNENLSVAMDAGIWFV